jgi:cellulose 1,4-beta-cellobiosidase
VLYWDKYLSESARVHGLSPFYWSTGGDPFDYDTAALKRPDIIAAMTGGTVPPPPDGAPYAASGLTATGGINQVTLSWTAGSGATSYNLYRATSSGLESSNAAPVVTGITGTSYTNTGLASVTKYYYQVVAVNASGISGFSPEAKATTSVDPNAPTLSNLGGITPTPGTYDIYQPSTQGNTAWPNKPDGINYYTDNTQPVGQTFTTGTNAVNLTTVAIKTGGLDSGGGYGTPGTTPTYYLRLYSVSSGTATLLNTFSAANPGFTDGDWLKWSGLNVPLGTNQTYAYTFGRQPSAGGYCALAVCSANAYSGAEIAVIPINGGTITNGSSHSYDATFVLGMVGNTPPALAAITNHTVNVGQTVAFTASATDTDSPLQTLTFALLAGATNATLDTNSGAFSFRPLVTQANSTNNFTLTVSDNGSPSLSATQSFAVVVNPLSMPGISNVSFVGGHIGFSINGQSGPDYAVETSTNLTQWSDVFITNSPALPFVWTDTNAAAPQRFYRVKLGPPLP